MITIIKDDKDIVSKGILNEQDLIKKRVLANNHKGIYSTLIYLKEEENLLEFGIYYKKLKISTNSVYFKATNKAGFTLKEKKLRVWGENLPMVNILCTIRAIATGRESNIIPFKEIGIKLNVDWIDENLYPYITSTVLRDILLKKITNNNMILKHWLKYNKCANVSVEKVMAFAKKYDKRNLMAILNISSNIERDLDYFNKEDNDCKLWKGGDYEYRDTMYQAFLLKEKINFTWSEKRFEQIHQKFTKIINKIEIGELSKERIKYGIKLNFNKGKVKWLDTQTKVYEEGQNMHHCIYSNYWNRINNKEYLAFHIENVDGKCTVGFKLNKNTQMYEFDQSNSAYNKSVPDSLKEIIVELVSSNKHILNMVYVDNNTTGTLDLLSGLEIPTF